MRATTLFLSLLLATYAAARPEHLSGPGTFRGAKAGALPSPFRHAHTTSAPSARSVQHKGAGAAEPTLHVSTYLSGPMPLEAGQVVFTDPAVTYLQFPNHPIALKRFQAEVVDENNASVPLYEVYNHHWIVFMNRGQGSLGECQSLSYVFGVGAESRNTLTEYPGNYALVTNGTETWTANIHLLRTVNVPHVKQCIECHCGPVDNPWTGGDFRCCEDGSFCPTDDQPKPPAKTYFLRYVIYWTEVTPDIIPVDTWVFDVSHCHIEYNVPPCVNQPCVDIRSKTFIFPRDVEIVYTAGHIHIGALNMTVTRTDTNQEVCHTFPIIGNGTEAGNEAGYVVGVNTCSFEKPLTIPAGQGITYTAYYDTRNGQYFDLVMGLFYVATIQPKH